MIHQKEVTLRNIKKQNQKKQKQKKTLKITTLKIIILKITILKIIILKIITLKIIILKILTLKIKMNQKKTQMMNLKQYQYKKKKKKKSQMMVIFQNVCINYIYLLWKLIEMDTEDEFRMLDEEGKAEVLALAQKMLRKKNEIKIINAAYNRYAYHDKDLPYWFEHEEHIFMK